jgi:hypothetical protein
MRYTVAELIELEAMAEQAGFVTVDQWAAALGSPDDRTLQVFMRVAREKAARLRELAQARAASPEPAPERKPKERGSARRARREKPAPKQGRSRPRKPLKSTHEGFRRAVDPAYAEGLFRLSPQLAHATVALQQIHDRYARALEACPAETRWRFRSLPACWTLTLAIAALCEAAGGALRIRGGTDLERGFLGRGAEFPRFLAMLLGRDYYSDTSCDVAYREAEDLGLGYRRQRLENEPIQCPVSGRMYQRRFGRNDFYVATTVHVVASRLTWLRPLVDELRKVLPGWLWNKTKTQRQERKRLVAWAEYVSTPADRRKELLRARAANRKRLKRWERRDREKRAQKQQTERSSPPLPITPPFSPTGRRGRTPAAPGGKVGATAPRSSGEAFGPLSPTGAATGPPGTVEAAEPPLGGTRGPEPPGGSAGSARQEGGFHRPWSRHLPTGPPESLEKASPEPVEASKPSALSPRAQQARERLRRLY